jgi:predicted DNA-binding protein
MSSVRTQIYLTRDQRRKLDARASRQDKTLAAVIRDAVDAYLVEEPHDVEQAMASTFGALPNLEVPKRAEWDRGVG